MQRKKDVTLTARVSVSVAAVGATLHGLFPEGMVTFQVKSGTTNIGTAVTDTVLTTPAGEAFGEAEVDYTLPENTGPGGALPSKLPSAMALGSSKTAR